VKCPSLKDKGKLLERGVGYLSDLELLAVLIGNGTKDCSVMNVAESTKGFGQRL